MSPELIWFALGLIVAGLAAGFVGGLFARRQHFFGERALVGIGE